MDNQCYAAFLYDELEEYEVAILRLLQCLETDLKNVAAHNNIAVMYWEIGQTEQAKKHFLTACNLSKKDPLPHENFGSFLKTKDEIKSAVSSYTRALEIDPNRSTANSALAQIFLDEGDFEKAVDYFSRAILAAPDFFSLL